MRARDACAKLNKMQKFANCVESCFRDLIGIQANPTLVIIFTCSKSEQYKFPKSKAFELTNFGSFIHNKCSRSEFWKILFFTVFTLGKPQQTGYLASSQINWYRKDFLDYFDLF